jgi:C4-dicarboxylate-specific signal transduction histidine kinase
LKNTGRAFFDEEGRMLRLIGMVADITDQKLSEEALSEMKEEAERMNRASEMGQLVASLTHELAQPLAAVLSNAQAASHLASRANPDLEEIKTALTDIIEDNQRANAVLNHVRSILKKHTVAPHRVNLNEIVEDVILIVRNTAQLRGVQLRSALCPEAILVQGDEVPLQQVLLNLVLNAMDAMANLPADRKMLTLKTFVQSANASGLMVWRTNARGFRMG